MACWPRSSGPRGRSANRPHSRHVLIKVDRRRVVVERPRAPAPVPEPVTARAVVVGGGHDRRAGELAACVAQRCRGRRQAPGADGTRCGRDNGRERARWAHPPEQPPRELNLWDASAHWVERGADRPRSALCLGPATESPPLCQAFRVDWGGASRAAHNCGRTAVDQVHKHGVRHGRAAAARRAAVRLRAAAHGPGPRWRSRGPGHLRYIGRGRRERVVHVDRRQPRRRGRPSNPNQPSAAAPACAGSRDGGGHSHLRAVRQRRNCEAREELVCAGQPGTRKVRARVHQPLPHRPRHKRRRCALSPPVHCVRGDRDQHPPRDVARHARGQAVAGPVVLRPGETRARGRRAGAADCGGRTGPWAPATANGRRNH